MPSSSSSSAELEDEVDEVEAADAVRWWVVSSSPAYIICLTLGIDSQTSEHTRYSAS
jgi:hypothetical protein